MCCEYRGKKSICGNCVFYLYFIKNVAKQLFFFMWLFFPIRYYRYLNHIGISFFLHWDWRIDVYVRKSFYIFFLLPKKIYLQANHRKIVKPCSVIQFHTNHHGHRTSFIGKSFEISTMWENWETVSGEMTEACYAFNGF